MSATAVLKDPAVCLSVAWAALQKLLGPLVWSWEAETIREELKRREIEPTDALMAKLTAAGSVIAQPNWCFDHDVFFTFSLACDGVSASTSALPHPTPEQLCWATREITALTGIRLNEDAGFDPDAVDPAIAGVLHDEGFVVAPNELNFVQDALDLHNRYGHDTDLREAVSAAWAELSQYTVDTFHRRLEQLEENAVGVQLRRLGDCKLYVAEKELLRAKQHTFLSD